MNELETVTIERDALRDLNGQLIERLASLSGTPEGETFGAFFTVVPDPIIDQRSSGYRQTMLEINCPETIEASLTDGGPFGITVDAPYGKRVQLNFASVTQPWLSEVKVQVHFDSPSGNQLPAFQGPVVPPVWDLIEFDDLEGPAPKIGYNLAYVAENRFALNIGFNGTAPCSFTGLRLFGSWKAALSGPLKANPYRRVCRLIGFVMAPGPVDQSAIALV